MDGEPTKPASGSAEVPFGCGASWMVRATVTFDDRKPELVTFEAIPLESDEATGCWDAVEAVYASLADSLSLEQKRATAWQTGLATLVAVVGISSLFANRDTVQKLDSVSAQRVTVLATVAALLVGTSVLLSLSAAVGWPSVKDYGSERDPSNASLEPIRRARLATRRMNLAAISAVLGFVLAVVVSGLFLWLPDAKHATEVNLTRVENGVLNTTCGTVDKTQPAPSTGAEGMIAFTPVGTSTSQLIPLKDVLGMAPGPCQ
ncbi:hypothetical protein N865_01195 [Intrasporangium oryzae NRRL B-24470]|uniref:Uncharacterized protein n=1 Tax=Intrasporangium oryzae NRRL B-24470 TaxID=1386089 RepID=W9G0Z5_9MICO|nr:hypothetical protein N865_01195 [Intrasporangium oryzae NRRL B-24470]